MLSIQHPDIQPTPYNFFKDHKSITVSVTEDGYAALYEAAETEGSMSAVLRRMLRFGGARRRKMRKVTVWVDKDEYTNLRAEAKENDTAFKSFCQEIVSRCVQDLMIQQRRRRIS
jgi:predicted CopG family antitoxin